MSKTRGSEKRKRTMNKSFRFSPEEWAEFTAKADAVGLPYAEYMRMQCLDRVPRRRLASPLDRKLAARLLGQLGKVGSNACRQRARARIQEHTARALPACIGAPPKEHRATRKADYATCLQRA